MLAFIRYTKGLTNNVIFARYRNESGYYYNFATSVWVNTESANTKLFLYEFIDDDPYESLYSRDITLPTIYDNNTVLEVVNNNTGEVLGIESILTYTKLSTFSFDSEGNVLATALGTIILPTLTGAAYSPTVTYGTLVKIVQYDTPTLTFNLNSNYTGWDIKLYYRQDATNITEVKDCTWVDATVGHATAEFTSVETNASGTYQCEVKVVKTGKILTVMKFTLAIQEGLTI